MISALRLVVIAKQVARGDDDVEQEIAIKFWRVSPETVTGAYRAAKWARDSWHRKQRRHEHEQLEHEN